MSGYEPYSASATSTVDARVLSALWFVASASDALMKCVLTGPASQQAAALQELDLALLSLMNAQRGK